MEQEITTGGFQALLRGRLAAISVQAVLSRDSDAAATVAFCNALLVSEYGLDSSLAALTAADHVARLSGKTQRARSLELTSRALVNIAQGNFNGAEKLALEAVALDQEQPASVFALGRARYRQGNLEGARRAFQAALVREPDFTEARVALAEVLLDGGQAALAKETLLAALQTNRHHGRAQLMLLEVQAALALGEATEWPSPCESVRQNSPYLAGFCDLVRAERAWRSQDPHAVRTYAAAMETHRPYDPRTIARAAQLLASLGFVDQAHRLTVEAGRLASSRFPALQWAQTAVDLGRGRLVEMPANLSLISSVVGASLLARIALASAGIEALSLAVETIRKNHFTQGPILHSFSVFLRIRNDSQATPDSKVSDPVEAYVRGLQARLAGDLSTAFRWLAQALSSHGDACRAAGEYLAVCRALEIVPAVGAFDFLKTENRGCVNLPAALAALKLPVVKSQKPRRGDKRPPRALE